MSFTSNSAITLLPTAYPPGTIIAKPDYLFKVLMIGESGAGKSALLARFVDGTFESNFISTIGVDFKIHYMKTETGKNIKIQVWDTAGQERFRTITTSYYRGASGVLIVFDVTDEMSFEKIRYWLNELKEHATPGIPIPPRREQGRHASRAHDRPGNCEKICGSDGPRGGRVERQDECRR